jgi:hypothetical protein
MTSPVNGCTARAKGGAVSVFRMSLDKDGASHSAELSGVQLTLPH